MPVQLDYARPMKEEKPRRPARFGAEMIKAAVLGVLFSVFSATPSGEIWGLLAIVTWAGIGIAWVVRSRRERDRSGRIVESHLSDRIWRPVVTVLAVLTVSIVIRWGRCPHQWYWAVGPYVHVTVTDPNGPCHNGYRLRPLLWYAFNDD